MSIRKASWRIAIALVIGGVLVGAYYLSPRLLYVESANARGEVLVVLGGDADGRTWKALELYRSEAATRILVSGDGDNELIRRRLELARVPRYAISSESESGNTRENAEFSVRWMREQKVRRAIVVTSWYHSRRALSCFRKFGPEIEYASAPCYHGLSMDGKPSVWELPEVFAEYLKCVWYLPRHGVWVWGT